MNRRDFLKTAAAAAAVASVQLSGRGLLGAEESKSKVAAVRGSDPAAMFRKGIEVLGGMKAFVKPGQTVTVKPNIGWDKTPEEGANTNPDLVAEIVRQALACGAKKVYVFDHTCNASGPSYRNSGIQAAAEAAGAEVLTADKESDYPEITVGKAVVMKHPKVFKAALEADVFINVPVLKNHGGAKMTCAMKNFMGVVWDRGFMHKKNLPQCIADSVYCRVPDLNVVDAYRVMMSNGPRGVSKNDVKEMGYQLLSRDIVAVDTLSAKLIGYKLDEVPYIRIGEKMGLGTTLASRMDLERVNA